MRLNDEPWDLPIPSAQRIIVFGVALSLLIPPERQPFSVGSIAELFHDIFHWDLRRGLEELNRCMKSWEHEPILNWYGNDIMHPHWIGELDYRLEDVPDVGLPTPRQVIAFAVALVWLVPEERRTWALESLVPLVHWMFGWPQDRGRQEITICNETWAGDGFEPNFWKDSDGRVHAGVPRKPEPRTAGELDRGLGRQVPDLPFEESDGRHLDALDTGKNRGLRTGGCFAIQEMRAIIEE